MKTGDSPSYLLCHPPSVISISPLGPKKTAVSTKSHILIGQHTNQEGRGPRTKDFSSSTSCHGLELWQLSFDHEGQG